MIAVAVSYLEWIRWVATGWFRCADRVVFLEGPEDQSGVDALMDRTPDLQVSDDQGYVIACLKHDDLLSKRYNGRERALGQLWLSVASVSRFYPLSARGARLLEADSERAAVRLGEPLFEKAWVDWRDRRLEEEAHWRGLSLCAAFGLGMPILENISSRVGDILAGRQPAPNAADVREKAIEGTQALGWASAMSVAVMEPEVRTAFKETPEFVEIQSLIKTYRADFDLRRPLLDDETTVKFARRTDVVLRTLGAQSLPLEVMATALHYRSLATGGRQLSLNALVEDLISIALADLNHASLSAYFIGRSMENVAVTTLLYQSEPTRYSALAPDAVRQQLNVMMLAAARLDAMTADSQTQKANSGLTSATEVSAESPKIEEVGHLTKGLLVEQTKGVQQTIDEEIKPRLDVVSSVAPNPSTPLDEPGAVSLNEGALSDQISPAECEELSCPAGDGETEASHLGPDTWPVAEPSEQPTDIIDRIPSSSSSPSLVTNVIPSELDLAPFGSAGASQQPASGSKKPRRSRKRDS